MKAREGDIVYSLSKFLAFLSIVALSFVAVLRWGPTSQVVGFICQGSSALVLLVLALWPYSFPNFNRSSLQEKVEEDDSPAEASWGLIKQKDDLICILKEQREELTNENRRLAQEVNTLLERLETGIPMNN